jgi:hypothetical protein
MAGKTPAQARQKQWNKLRFICSGKELAHQTELFLKSFHFQILPDTSGGTWVERTTHEKVSKSGERIKPSVQGAEFVPDPSPTESPKELCAGPK